MNAAEALEVREIDWTVQRDVIERFLDSVAADGRSPPLDAILAEAIAGRFPLSVCFGAFHAGNLIAVGGGQNLPGRCVSLWLPRLAPGATASAAEAIFARLGLWLEKTQARIAQLLLEAPTTAERTLLENHEFVRLTELFYMVCQWAEYPTVAPAADLVFEPYSPAQHERLKRIIEETYRGTLDCPQLNDVRDTEDVLVGYRSTGVFDPARWLLVSRQDEDVGCLLLTDHPSDGNLELVYTGVTPTTRGRGLGVAIVRHAAWVARQMGRRRLVVGVDAANSPAVRMYETAGFWLADRRDVYLRVFER